MLSSVFLCVSVSTSTYLFSEEEGEKEQKQVWYYSSRQQLEELMEVLDRQYWESDLCAALEEVKEETHAHMDITDDLTSKARGNNKAYLTAVNGELGGGGGGVAL